MPEETKISRITIGRLHNLGNYEHVRYEISVDIGSDDDAGIVLKNLETVLNDMQINPGVDSWALRNAKEILKKPEAELTDHERSNLDAYRGKVAKVEDAVRRMSLARERLTSFSGTSVFTDAKENWDEEHRY